MAEGLRPRAEAGGGGPLPGHQDDHPCPPTRPTDAHPVLIPIDCGDGFTEAFYACPESYLDPAVRRAESAWTFLEPGVEERAMTELAADLPS